MTSYSGHRPGGVSDTSDIAYDSNHTGRQTDSYNDEQLMSGYSLNDTSSIKTENQMLKASVRQMQQECQSEQDLVNELRKRLMTSDKEKLESSSKANGEISSLQTQLAKLRAQLEKGEAESQSLQYELAKSRQETSQERRSGAERDQRMTQLNENTKYKLTELTNQMEQLYAEINAVRKTSEEDQTKFAMTLDEKENILSNVISKKDVLEAENGSLKSLIQSQERTIQNLEDRGKELEEEKRKQTEEQKQSLREIAYKNEKEAQLKKDLEEAAKRIRSLEENIEAERAAHLESKFNSEIIQLKVHELEGALEVEKSAKRDATAAIEKLNTQLSSIEGAYDEERKSAKETKEQLNKFEDEYSTVCQQLSREVENKKNIIDNLSAQLEPHQKNFDELKEELCKAKKRQLYLEETYGGSMRELELLIRNFQTDGHISEAKSKTAPKLTKTKLSSDVLLPAEIIEQLRHLLSVYKQRLDATTTELSKIKTANTTQNKEITSLKKVLMSKERVLDETQHNLTKSHKDVNKLKMETSQLQMHLNKVSADLKTTTQTSEKERIRANGLSDELMKVARKHKDDNEEHMKSLHGIYQHFLAGHIISNMSKEVSALNSFTWIELSGLVHEQISSSINNLHRLQEKVRHLEVVIQNKEKMLDDVQKCHQGQLERLASTLQDHELTYQQQKQQLDQHYQDMLSEVQSQSKKQQAMADQAWEKVRVTGSVQQSLQAECSTLQQHLSSARHDHAALLSAVSLLTGALYPLYIRTNQLAAQKGMMQEQISAHTDITKQIKVITEAMDCAQNGTDVSESRFVPLLKFRVGVIAIIAANRLCHFSHTSYKMFAVSSHQLGIVGSVVWTGRKVKGQPSFRGLNQGSHPAQPSDSNATWLKSAHLMKIVKKSMCSLQEAISANKDAGQLDNKALSNAAKTAFLTFMDRVGGHFEGHPIDLSQGCRGKSSLTWQLSLGLKRVLSRTSAEHRLDAASPHQMLTQLQKQLMTMTQNLHSSEVERRNLRQELNLYKQDKQDLRSTSSRLRHLEEQLETQQQQSIGQVPGSTFEGVCHELDAALRREEQAQRLLQEQSLQLQQLNDKLQTHASHGNQTQNTITKAAQELSECKMDLRRKEQSVRQMGRSVTALQNEKQGLQENLRDAENALRTAAKDKDVHSGYVHSVIASLQTIKHHLQLNCSLQDVDLSSLLTVEKASKLGSEVSASRSLVSEFVELYQLVSANTAALNEQIASHRQHINTLKKELNAACQREYSADHLTEEEYEAPEKRTISPRLNTPFKSKSRTTPKDVFMPLMEDTDPSYSFLQPSPRSKTLPSPV